MSKHKSDGGDQLGDVKRPKTPLNVVFLNPLACPLQFAPCHGDGQKVWHMLGTA